MTRVDSSELDQWNRFATARRGRFILSVFAVIFVEGIPVQLASLLGLPLNLAGRPKKTDALKMKIQEALRR